MLKETQLGESTSSSTTPSSEEQEADDYDEADIRNAVVEPWMKIAQYRHQELGMGEILGRGQFSVVRQVVQYPTRLKHAVEHELEMRQRPEILPAPSSDSVFSGIISLASKGRRKSPEKRRAKVEFVAKLVNRADFATEKKYLNASTQLDNEANLLAAIQHPHVIKLWGMSFPDNTKERHFLLLEKLEGTLERRVQEWKGQVGFSTSIFGKCFSATKDGDLILERFKVAAQLAEAMKHIHSKRMVHRDLKPANVGFDSMGNVRVFDFGLTAELTSSRKTKDGLYKLTGRTGSLMYMAPEVHRNLPYNDRADVYSLAIILWEIFALERSFNNFIDPKVFVREVFDRGQRPDLERITCDSVVCLLQSAWSGNIFQRPSAEEIWGILRSELADAKRTVKEQQQALASKRLQ